MPKFHVSRAVDQVTAASLAPRIPDTGPMSQPAGSLIPKAAPRSGLRVLVVDDERALADLVGSYLTRDGFEVSMAYDGQQAIDQARQVDPESGAAQWSSSPRRG